MWLPFQYLDLVRVMVRDVALARSGWFPAQLPRLLAPLGEFAALLEHLFSLADFLFRTAFDVVFVGTFLAKVRRERELVRTVSASGP